MDDQKKCGEGRSSKMEVCMKLDYICDGNHDCPQPGDEKDVVSGDENENFCE